MKGAHKEMRGFEYLVYSVLSSALLVVLVSLPLAPVFADEIVSEATPLEPIEVPVETPVEEIIVAPDEVSVGSDTQEEVAPQPSEVEPVVEETIPEEVDLSVIDTPVQIDETYTADTSYEVPVDESVEEVVPPVETETILEEVLPEVPAEESTTTENVMVEEEITEEEIEDIEITIPTTTVAEQAVSVVTNDENKFSFSKNECTTVGDGTFYCATASETPTVLYTDRIFSAIDVEGDKEIYVEKGGELSTITENSVDDDAPYFDEVSNTAVWHRLIDGRYQIVRFDFDTGEETQLTNDRYNNMQPSAFGDAVVWQGWVGNDWEIFFELEGTLTMLTDNTTHDIAPSVNGTHIVWQSFEGDAWRMKVYDIRSGAIDVIEDADGGSIENPRFVLVYDAKMDTGDIETRGYDLKSGTVLDLASRPTQVPEEIPDPEQTGEERALVAPSTQPKPKTDTDTNDDVGTTTDNGLDEGDLVIPALTDDVSGTSTPEISIEAEDVVIPSYSEGTTTNEVGIIEDLVVEPYVPFEEVLEEDTQI